MKNRNLLAALAGAVLSAVAVTLETRRQTNFDEIKDDVDDARDSVAEKVATDRP